MSNGYTLVELLVVAAILGTVSALGILGFANIQRDQSMINALNQVAGDIRDTKLKAKELQVPCRLQVTGATTYQIRYDNNRDGFGDAGDTVRNVTLSGLVTFSASDVAKPQTSAFTWKGDTDATPETFTLTLGTLSRAITVFAMTGMVVIQ